MKHQTMIMGGIVAAGIIAVVLCVGLVTGFSGIGPFTSSDPLSATSSGILSASARTPPGNSGLYITIDPVADKTTGDLLIVSGSTNLPEGTTLMVKAGNSGGNAVVRSGSGGVNQFSSPVDTSDMEPGTKKITVTNMIGDLEKGDYRKGDVNATASFELKGTHLTTDTPVRPTITNDDFIRINAIGDRSVGDLFLVTGTTSLPVGTEFTWQVTPASFTTNPDQQTGTFTGSMGKSQVTKGTGSTNRVSFAMDTYALLPAQYNVTIAAVAGNLSEGDYSTHDLMGIALFTLNQGPASVTAAATSDTVAAGGILIDTIRDTTYGDLLTVTGSTNLSVGTDLVVKVIPASMDNATIVRDYQNPENAAVIKVVKGSGINNRFSVALDTRFIPAGEHIVFVSEMNDTAAGTGSGSTGWTGSALFNIIADTTGASRTGNNTSVPTISLNPINDITPGDPLTVTGTTNVPAGSTFRVMVIPESSTDYGHPELSATISTVKGSGTHSLFSVALATKDLPKGEHIFIISAEDYDMTGSTLFTVR
ncbi:MAG: hypothetical protein WC342_08995 [Methanoregula sp.]|jgi:hypothetical protein